MTFTKYAALLPRRFVEDAPMLRGYLAWRVREEHPGYVVDGEPEIHELPELVEPVPDLDPANFRRVEIAVVRAEVSDGTR